MYFVFGFDIFSFIFCNYYFHTMEGFLDFFVQLMAYFQTGLCAKMCTTYMSDMKSIQKAVQHNSKKDHFIEPKV